MSSHVPTIGTLNVGVLIYRQSLVNWPAMVASFISERQIQVDAYWHDEWWFESARGKAA